MKKAILLGLALSFLTSTPVVAAPDRDCLYHPLQEIIRSARSTQDIAPWIKDGVNFNMNFKCGGSILQLAILRGNPEVLQLLLEKGNINPNALVSNEDFPIKGAPRTFPIGFFAAYYAPRADILNLFIKHAGESIYQKDSNGQDILWYIEQNPVLRKTALSDMLVRNLLIEDTNEFNQKEYTAKQKALEQERLAQQKKALEEQSKRKTISDKKTNEQPQKTIPSIKKGQKQNTQKSSQIIEDDLGNAFNPTSEAKVFDVTRSDF